ncbi:hypothetical protein C4579_00025 [Candidatus Microgenomates bacterium]|nr:MAG: hypothetical protein C4579_00025 [Candidatus Microgenomates bacterium]
MNNDQVIIKELQQLKALKAPDSLRERILLQSSELIKSQHQQVRPVFLPLWRLALIIVLVLLLTTSGVAVAALKSQPGQLLYGLKAPIEQILGRNQEVTTPPQPENEQQKESSIQPESQTNAAPALKTNLDTTITTDQSETQVDVHASIPPSATPLPSIIPTPNTSVNLEVETPVLGVSVGLSNEAQPSPTPSPVLDVNIQLPDLPIKIGL